MKDAIEFFHGDRLLVIVQSSHAPDRGDLVNIRKVTYRVIGRTYTVDHSDEPRERQVVCVVNLTDEDAPAALPDMEAVAE